VTPFFVAQLNPGDPAAENLYRSLRNHAEACTGGVSRERRIHELDCRYEGTDRRITVGECDGPGGSIVQAILQLGRDTFTVHHVSSALEDPTPPTVLRRGDIYSVTEFD
jgi:hypothetical protein